MSSLILKNIKIQNLATFTNQVIEFSNNLNTIIGETGSGKSLILDALQLCFGARADKRLVRKDSEFTSVEVIFQATGKETHQYFNDIGYPFEDEIIIKRVIYKNGKSKSYLNLNQCSLATLSLTSKRFIDLVGQFENQKLLSSDYQMQLLDSYAKNETLLKNYQDEFDKLKNFKLKLIDLNETRQRSVERKDFLDFQIKELEKLNPCPEEEKDLKETKEKIINFENIQKSLSKANYLLSESENSIITQFASVSKELLSLNINSELVEKLNSDLEDLSFNVSNSIENEFPEEDLSEVIDRLDKYQGLKRKYNTDTEGLLNIYNKYKVEFDQLEIIDDELNNIHKSISKQSIKCHSIADKLHTKRVFSAKKLSKQLTSLVRDLKMDGAEINLSLNKSESFDSNGLSKINFLAQTNIGEGFHPIKEIASGGELSRVLLALRQVLSKSESISVFLFDEIDTGIGGETALCIGSALKEVSMSSQVIAITHLPQIAKFADRLVVVNKESESKRTVSKVTHIEKKEKDSYIQEMIAL